MGRCWYSYNGVGDPLLPTNYNQSAVKPSCISGAVTCAIYAPGCGPNPSSPLSSRMRTYIANLQLGLIPQPSYPPGAKKYVYGRTA